MNRNAYISVALLLLLILAPSVTIIHGQGLGSKSGSGSDGSGSAPDPWTSTPTMASTIAPTPAPDSTDEDNCIQGGGLYCRDNSQCFNSTVAKQCNDDCPGSCWFNCWDITSGDLCNYLSDYCNWCKDYSQCIDDSVSCPANTEPGTPVTHITKAPIRPGCWDAEYTYKREVWFIGSCVVAAIHIIGTVTITIWCKINMLRIERSVEKLEDSHHHADHAHQDGEQQINNGDDDSEQHQHTSENNTNNNHGEEQLSDRPSADTTTAATKPSVSLNNNDNDHEEPLLPPQIAVEETSPKPRPDPVVDLPRLKLAWSYFGYRAAIYRYLIAIMAALFSVTVLSRSLYVMADPGTMPCNQNSSYQFGPCCSVSSIFNDVSKNGECDQAGYAQGALKSVSAFQFQQAFLLLTYTFVIFFCDFAQFLFDLSRIDHYPWIEELFARAPEGAGKCERFFIYLQNSKKRIRLSVVLFVIKITACASVLPISSVDNSYKDQTDARGCYHANALPEQFTNAQYAVYVTTAPLALPLAFMLIIGFFSMFKECGVKCCEAGSDDTCTLPLIGEFRRTREAWTKRVFIAGFVVYVLFGFYCEGKTLFIEIENGVAALMSSILHTGMSSMLPVWLRLFRHFVEAFKDKFDELIEVPEYLLIMLEKTIDEGFDKVAESNCCSCCIEWLLRNPVLISSAELPGAEMMEKIIEYCPGAAALGIDLDENESKALRKISCAEKQRIKTHEERKKKRQEEAQRIRRLEEEDEVKWANRPGASPINSELNTRPNSTLEPQSPVSGSPRSCAEQEASHSPRDDT